MKFHRIIALLCAAALLLPAAPKVAAPSGPTPKAIGAMPMTGVHYVAPRDEVVVQTLQSDGKLPLNATSAQIDQALKDFRTDFSHKSVTWANPTAQMRALEREQQTAAGNTINAAVQPVSVEIFTLAVDFAGTDTFTDYPVPDGTDDQGNTICTPSTFTTTGPAKGEITHPGARDNNTVWYTPEETADPVFYEDLIFGYTGAGRVRMDLTDPVDDQPGINLSGITVQDYYDHVAGKGNVTLNGTVQGWVSVDHSEAYYGADDCASGNNDQGLEKPVGQLIADSVAKFQAQHPTYFTDTSADAFWKQFDADQDGVLDTFWIIHAGMGQEAGGGAQGDFSIWSHSSDVRYYPDWPEGIKVYEGDPNTTEDDIVVGPYTMQPENADVGVFTEEFGHNFFGFPDLYTLDVQGSIGFWSIMEAGAWGGYLGGSAPVGMPLWFRMIAQCGDSFCNWQNPMQIRDYLDTTAEYNVGQLEDTPEGALKGVRVNLPPTVEDIPNQAGNGKGAYTGSGINMVELDLDRTIDVPADGNLKLLIPSVWDIELDYDYGYVSVKTAGGDFVSLPDEDGNMVAVGSQFGLTGSGQGVLKFDLSPYAGQTVTLRISYVTDPAVNGAGWWIDDLSLGDVLIDDFESATDSGTFPGWTNSDPGWQVVPSTKTYNQYYLVEWRNATKYDQYVKTAYVTTYADDDEWQVERIPYQIPGALLYYRNTKYTSTYAADPNYGDPPSYGPKYQLLVVDMNYGPMRLGDTARYLNSRVSSYDAALTLTGSPELSLSKVNGVDGGPYTFAAEPAVTTFNDVQGYYAGFYFGDPCDPGYLCYNNADGSAVIPARDKYSVRITDFAGNLLPDMYGYPFGPSWLGTGNPGDDNVEMGVNFSVLSQNADGSIGRLIFRNLDRSNSVSYSLKDGAYLVTMTTVLDNQRTSVAKDVVVDFAMPSEMSLVSASINSQPIEATTSAKVSGHQDVSLGVTTLEPGTKTTIIVVGRLPLAGLQPVNIAVSFKGGYSLTGWESDDYPLDIYTQAIPMLNR